MTEITALTAFARFAVAALQKFCNERLQDKRIQVVQLYAADLVLDMLLYDEPVTLVSPHFHGRADIVFQPLNEPIYVLHISSKTCKFSQMAVRCALGLYTSRLAALAEAKRTPEQAKRANGNQRRRRRGRSPLTRLANRPLIPSRHALIVTVR